MTRAYTFLILFLFASLHTQAQRIDSLYAQPSKAGYYFAGGLMTAGVIMDSDKIKEGVRDWVRDRVDIPETRLDDIAQHLPLLMMYSTDLIMKTPKAEVGRQTRHFIVAQGITIGTTLLLKSATSARRPNGGTLSFPSGHTAYAMAGANIFYHSFKDENKLLALSAYVPVAVVGAFRMIKDKHWVSDVVFGAGYGFLVSQLTYDLNIWNSRKIGDPSYKPVTLRLGTSPNGMGLTLNF